MNTIGHEKSLAYEPWPQYDESFCLESVVTVALQVNGKVRAKVEVQLDIAEAGIYSSFDILLKAPFSNEKECVCFIETN